MPDILVFKDGEAADGAVRIVEHAEVEIAVIRHNGKYYAYRNLCPHQGGPVCEGLRMPLVVDKIEADGSFSGQIFDETDMHIVCPWHGYEYHLETGENVCDKKIRLKRYSVSERDGGVYVSI